MIADELEQEITHVEHCQLDRGRLTIEVLNRIRQGMPTPERLKDVVNPIIILTTSREEKDIAFTMQAGAESFITKPATFNEWVQIMKVLAESLLS